MRETAMHGRPLPIWIISLFYLVTGVWGLFSFWLVLSGAISINEPVRRYLEQLTPLDYAIAGLSGLTNVSAAIALFMLRRFAYRLFIVGLALNMGITVWHIASKGFSPALGNGGMAGLISGWGILIAVCLYARHLSESGRLH